MIAVEKHQIAQPGLPRQIAPPRGQIHPGQHHFLKPLADQPLDPRGQQILELLQGSVSRMDDMIYEEFKGTGNMELMLDRALQEQRIFPAVSIVRSGTRHDEMLLSRDEETVALRVRRMIAGSSEQEGISMVLSMMDRTKDNEDFVARFDQWAKMMGNGGARQ